MGAIKNMGRYIGGGFVIMIGSVLSLVGILLMIETLLVLYDPLVLAGSILLLIAGIIIASLGQNYRDRKNSRNFYLHP